VTPEEVKALIAGFKDPAGLQANGIRLQGIKYIFLRNIEDRSIYGKKVRPLSPSPYPPRGRN